MSEYLDRVRGMTKNANDTFEQLQRERLDRAEREKKEILEKAKLQIPMYIDTVKQAVEQAASRGQYEIKVNLFSCYPSPDTAAGIIWDGVQRYFKDEGFRIVGKHIEWGMEGGDDGSRKQESFHVTVTW